MPNRKKYSDSYRERFLREALKPGGLGPWRLAKERGVSNGAVYRWLQGARKLASMADKPRRPDDLGPEDKLRVLTETARLSDAELGDYLRRHGVHEDDLRRWREEALGALGGSAKAPPPSKRIRALERELARKEKALAEAAALLVLAKKARALWGDEDDDTSED